MGTATLVAYECVAPDHQPGLVHPDKLTIYERRWAFCPFDARADGHEWRETGGADLSAMLRRVGLTVALKAMEPVAETQASKR